MAVTPQTVGTQFLEAYFKAFRTNRAELRNFYTETSQLHWDLKPYKGLTVVPGADADPIPNCFERIRFNTVEYHNLKHDIQVTPGSGLLIVVTGYMKIDGASELPFTHVFLLMSTPQGSWYINNEVFRFGIA